MLAPWLFLLPLLVPAAAWMWHLALAARGRDYPIASFAMAAGSALLVGLLAYVALRIFYEPPAVPRNVPSENEGPATLVVTIMVAFLGGAAMLPAELIVACVWTAARALRARRARTSRA